MNFSNIRSDLATESLEQLEVGKHYQKEEYVNDGVKVEKGGETQNLGKFDFIVYATGSKPDPSLYEAIRETGKETYLFGDASCVAQALEAVRDGVNIALKL